MIDYVFDGRYKKVYITTRKDVEEFLKRHYEKGFSYNGIIQITTDFIFIEVFKKAHSPDAQRYLTEMIKGSFCLDLKCIQLALTELANQDVIPEGFIYIKR